MVIPRWPKQPFEPAVPSTKDPDVIQNLSLRIHQRLHVHKELADGPTWTCSKLYGYIMMFEQDMNKTNQLRFWGWYTRTPPRNRHKYIILYKWHSRSFWKVEDEFTLGLGFMPRPCCKIVWTADKRFISYVHVIHQLWTCSEVYLFECQDFGVIEVPWSTQMAGISTSTIALTLFNCHKIIVKIDKQHPRNPNARRGATRLRGVVPLCYLNCGRKSYIHKQLAEGIQQQAPCCIHVCGFGSK